MTTKILEYIEVINMVEFNIVEMTIISPMSIRLIKPYDTVEMIKTVKFKTVEFNTVRMIIMSPMSIRLIESYDMVEMIKTVKFKMIKFNTVEFNMIGTIYPTNRIRIITKIVLSRQNHVK